MDRISRISITIKSNNKRKIKKSPKPKIKRDNRNKEWITHVKQTKEDNPNLSGKELFILSKETSTRKHGAPKEMNPYRLQWLEYWNRFKNEPDYTRMSYYKKRYYLKKAFERHLAEDSQLMEEYEEFTDSESEIYFTSDDSGDELLSD
jgi:hypothetical protein